MVDWNKKKKEIEKEKRNGEWIREDGKDWRKDRRKDGRWVWGRY